MDDSYLGMLQEDPFATYNYYGSQVYVNATSPGTSSAHFVHPYVHPSHPSPKAAKMRIQGKGKTRAEKGAKVQRNKRQSTTRLSQSKSGIW